MGLVRFRPGALSKESALSFTGIASTGAISRVDAAVPETGEVLVVYAFSGGFSLAERSHHLWVAVSALTNALYRSFVSLLLVEFLISV